MVSVRYGFGDAAKSGFGASFQKVSGSVWYRMGVWGSDEEVESSNFRELSNLVEALEAQLSLTAGLCYRKMATLVANNRNGDATVA